MIFGRRKHTQSTDEAAHEAERRALFEKLAERPDTVCPFLGLAELRTDYQPQPTDAHRCYAFGDPAPLSFEQQERVCLQRGYGNCPRYLRGVLVIPTEELEALRRPQPMPTPPPASRTRGAAAPPERRRRGGLIISVLLLLLLVAGGAGGAYLLLGVGGAGGGPLPTPTPSSAPSVTSTPAASPTPEPTVTAGDVFINVWQVALAPGDYTIYRIDVNGAVTLVLPAHFDGYSRADVDEITAPNGLHYWRTKDGGYAGLSYIRGRSGGFAIRKVFRAPSGDLHYQRLADSEI